MHLNSRKIFISNREALGPAGFLTDHLMAYESSRTSLKNLRWGSQDLVVGPIPDEIMGADFSFWKKSFHSRLERMIQLLLAKLGPTWKIEPFDAVVVARGRTKAFDPRESGCAHPLSNSKYLKSWLGNALTFTGVPINPAKIFFVNASCVSGLAALDVARKQIQAGSWSRVLLLSFDLMYALNIQAFNALGILSRGSPGDFPKVYHPDRNGVARAEAATAVVLQHEPTEGSLELCGTYLTSDGSAGTSIEESGGGLRSCIENCLKSAQLAMADIALVKGHGTGTKTNDQLELNVLAALRRQGTAPVPVISFKAQFGHAMGANALFELALLSEIMNRGVIMPVFHGGQMQGSEGRSAALSRKMRIGPGEAVLGLAEGMGGLNGSYIVRRRK